MSWGSGSAGDHPVSAQYVAHECAQVVHVKRLHQHAADAQAHSMVFQTGCGGCQQHRRLPIRRFAVRGQERFGVHAGHAQIEHDQIGRPVHQEVECFLGARTRPDIPSVVNKRQLDASQIDPSSSTTSTRGEACTLLCPRAVGAETQSTLRVRRMTDPEQERSGKRTPLSASIPSI